MTMKKRNIYLLAFFIPIMIFFLMAFLAKYIPFYDEVFQVFDARHQYPGFYTELMTKLREGNLFFSFNGGLGFNFLGTITYYLMSPLNLLMVFFDAKSLSLFFMVTIYLRIGLSGLTMAIYLNNQKNKKDIWVITFSVIFALMGFLSGYYYNFMWIDSIIMLPLILLGIDKLVNDKKVFLYIFSLTLGIIFNYYIGVMLCIFSLIYFIYKIFSEEDISYIPVIKRFIISSLVVGLLSLFILIPTYYSLLIGKAKIYGTDWMNYFEFNKNYYSFFYKLTPASYHIDHQSYGPAMIYSSLFSLALVILFFFNNKFKLREKIVVAIILIFYYFCFSYNLLDYGWQLFQKPIWWQSRYSFTFSTFLIIIAFKNIVNIDNLKLNKAIKLVIIWIMSILFIMGAILVLKDVGPSNYNSSAYFFLIFSIMIFAQMIYFIDDKSTYWYLIVLVVLELSINSYNGLIKTTFKNNKVDLEQKIVSSEKSLNYIKNIDNDFYRMEFINLNTTNDGMLHNYHGINIFTSARNQKTIDFLEFKMELDVDSGCGVKFKSYNPALLSLLNVKYLIGDVDYYPLCFENDDKNVHENPFPLGLGFMVNEKIKDLTLLDDDLNNNLDSIYSAFIDKDVSFIKYIDNTDLIDEEVNVIKSFNGLRNFYHRDKEQFDSYITLNYTADGNYILLPDDVFKRADKIYIDGNLYKKNNGNFIHLKKGQSIKVTYKISDTTINQDDLYFYLFDLNKYEEAVKELNSIFKINTKSKNLIEGKVDVTNDKNILFTSIPYEDGLSIKVNGKNAKPIKLLDTFVGLELEEGQNHIIINYFPKGLGVGLIISGLTFLGLICYYIASKKEVFK